MAEEQVHEETHEEDLAPTEEESEGVSGGHQRAKAHEDLAHANRAKFKAEGDIRSVNGRFS